MKEWLKVNLRLVESTDHEKVFQIRQQQIDLLGGSESLYERIHHNLATLTFESYFAKEQYMLYEWRENFFYKEFGNWVIETNDGKWVPGGWFTTGADDSHGLDTVPFQITQNFNGVMILACAPRTLGTRVYFENNEGICYTARYLFELSRLDSKFDIYRLEDLGISITDGFHMIAAMHGNNPLKLEDLAMKKLVASNVSLEKLPKSLKEKASRGFFSTSKQVEEFVDDEGKKVLSIMLLNNEESSSNEEEYDTDDDDDNYNEDEGHMMEELQGGGPIL